MIYAFLPIIITALIAIILISVLLFFLRQREKIQKQEEFFFEQLKYAAGENRIISNKTPQISPHRWNAFWGYRLKYSDMLSSKYSDGQVGTLMFLLFGGVYVIFTLMFKNVGIGLVPVISIYGVLIYITSDKIKKKELIFEDQIPGFLSTLKSNIQANETPERALINAINTTASPLYDELKIAKSLTETGTFQVALHTLRTQTKNKTLKFLCSCIELATSVGANLEEQITIIENMLEKNREMKRKLDIAIAENRPLLFVSAAILPGLFLFMYFLSEIARNFWFHSLLSWVAFFAIIIIYGAGVLFTNRIIQNTSKF